MKKYIYFVLLAILSTTWCSCSEDISDETIVVDTVPGFIIYKSRSDYFNYMSMKFYGDSITAYSPYFQLPDPRIIATSKDTIYTFRYQLKKGFILDLEGYTEAYFTNITYSEYINNYQRRVNVDSLFWHRVIDKDPYIELYQIRTLTNYEEFTLGEINEMIEAGTLSDKFNKIK